ncbi:MAG: hypothetical protein LBH59_08005, partial [Planctomycetaceae bacterium]|nr:hypothetical protein [Planctomycetaceae bacterium]
MKAVYLFFVVLFVAAQTCADDSTLPNSNTKQLTTNTQWTKYENNPVLDGKKYGTCFDLTMLKEDGLYKMWFSWRPKRSIAYCESKDGINWSTPVIVLSPANNDWEKNALNRPSIYKKDGIYHLWYTGQSNGQSWIGYAQSKDGLKFERQSERPVLEPEAGWEKNIAV